MTCLLKLFRRRRVDQLLQELEQQLAEYHSKRGAK